jgi:hypothetical protein
MRTQVIIVSGCSELQIQKALNQRLEEFNDNINIEVIDVKLVSMDNLLYAMIIYNKKWQ